jgi:hypothetical protein
VPEQSNDRGVWRTGIKEQQIQRVLLPVLARQ